MSTRANIAIKENGVYTYIYNHYDSYIYGLGITLYRYYNTPERVKALIALGDTSSIGRDIEGNALTYEEYLSLPVADRYTAAYYRDCNQWGDYGFNGTQIDWNDVKPKQSENVEKILGDYTYIYDTDTNKWIVACWDDEYQLRDLETVLHSEELILKIVCKDFLPERIPDIRDKCLKA